MLSEAVIEVIIQAAPTAWTSPPRFEARLASQIARNVRSRSGASDDARSLAAVSMRRPDSFPPVDNHADADARGNPRPPDASPPRPVSTKGAQ